MNASKSQNTTQTLAPIYLIHGDELLLINEARQQIRNKAKEAGFLEREVWIVESGFNWNQFSESLQNFNLFSSKSMVELQFPTAKWDDKATQFLLHYLSAPSSHNVLVILMPKLNSSQQKSRWYQAISKQGVINAIRPIYSYELPQWIKKRLTELSLSADTQSIQLLAESTEGNLLATHQAIEKLHLLFPKQPITVKEMAAVISNQSRYSIFDLSTAALQGKGTKVLHILKNLRAEGAEPILILWSFLQELRRLSNIATEVQNGKSLSDILKSEWAVRRSMLQQALSRHTIASIHQLILLSNKIDMMIKGVYQGNMWNALDQLGVGLAGQWRNL